MIIVTGTKRSGTSMWMQIMRSAGFPIFGEAFPRNWEKTIKSANPDGFFESSLRQGIYYRTNPHPKSGAFFRPEQVKRHAVKVFIPGLVRTDLAYIGKVVASVREWREYVRSIERMHAMELENRPEDKRDQPPPEYMPPALEWWGENFSLLRDIVTRGYPFHLQSYDGLLADPRGVLEKTFQWLGEGDLEEALGAVKPENRTQKRPEVDVIEPKYAAVFDDLCRSIHEGTPLGPHFVKRLNDTHLQLLPRLREHQEKLVRAGEKRRRPKRARKAPGP
jgi:hypothetical protein